MANTAIVAATPLTAEEPVQRSPVPPEIDATRVIAIARGVDAEWLLRAADCLAAEGVRALEVTLDSPGAFSTIGRLRSRFEGALLVGAGTVIAVDDVVRAVSAGAEFMVSPGFSDGVVTAAVSARVAVIPGALSPTEVLAAWSSGATAVKLFPASSLGTTYLRAIRAPLASVPLVATGGVDASNAAAFFAAGAYAVGVGEWLFADNDMAELRARARQIVDIADKGAGR